MSTFRCFKNSRCRANSGKARIAGIKFIDSCMMRLMKVLLYCANSTDGARPVSTKLFRFALMSSLHRRRVCGLLANFCSITRLKNLTGQQDRKPPKCLLNSAICLVVRSTAICAST